MIRSAALTSVRLALILVWFSLAARAQSRTDWWPQFYTYVGLTPTIQVSAQANGTITSDSPNQQLILGPSIDFSLAPFLLPRVKTLDNTRNNYLNFRLAYRYVATVGDRSSHSHRGIVELTPRFPLPGKLVLADRNQLVLVGDQQGVSWLYRNRVNLARSFQTGRLTFTPYVRGQVTYDSEPGAWVRYNCGVGSTFKVNTHLQLEPFYRHVGNIESTARPVNGLGLKVQLFFRNQTNP